MTGPGTLLTRRFESFWIRSTEDCPCRIVAAAMDRWGADGMDREFTSADHEWMAERVAERQRGGYDLGEWLALRWLDIGLSRFRVVMQCLSEEAKERGLPFSWLLTKLLVRRAINQSRRLSRAV